MSKHQDLMRLALEFARQAGIREERARQEIMHLEDRLDDFYDQGVQAERQRITALQEGFVLVPAEEVKNG